jgi:recombination associated protein RdgC
MWFKNIQLFGLVDGFTLDSAELSEALSSKPLREVGALEIETSGFASPYSRADERLVHTIGKSHLFRLGAHKKILPGSVVNEEIAKKVDSIKAKEAREVGRKERMRLKDDVLTELLPRAFSQPSSTDAYIDGKNGWLIVDAGARKKAETLTEELRKTLGSMKLVAAPDIASLRSVMTTWLKDDALPDGFGFGDEIDLKDEAGDGSIARCRKQDLSAGEVREHLKAGKEVTALALNFGDRLSFVLTEQGGLKKLKFQDVVQEAIGNNNDGLEAELDARFALMQLEIEQLLKVLLKVVPLLPERD